VSNVDVFVVVVIVGVIVVVDVVDMTMCLVGLGDEQKTTFIALWLRVVNFWVIIPWIPSSFRSIGLGIP